jgi:hypothetical protein
MTEQSNISNSSEIDKALKDFETDQGQEPPKIQTVITPQSPKNQNSKVDGVSYSTDAETESYRAVKFYKETAEPKIVKTVIKYSGGVVKNQKQAEWILLVFVILAIAVSIYLFFGFGNTRQQVTPAELERMRHPNIK